jgi:Fe-S-cluster containining protein
VDKLASATIRFEIDGDRFEAGVTVPAGLVPPSRLLPTFRGLAEALVGVGVEKAAAEGLSISCAKGCGACCRQLVPVSPTEAGAIAELVDRMPPERREVIRRRFADARERVAAAGLLERLTGAVPVDASEYDRFGLEYFRLGIACPFLEDEACSIYEERPIACREYLVTSDPVHCASPSRETVACVRLPARVSNALGRIGPGGVAGRPWVPLILAPEWAGANPEPPPSRTGPELVEEVVRHLASATKERDR